jgi:hypothetical protein
MWLPGGYTGRWLLHKGWYCQWGVQCSVWLHRMVLGVQLLPVLVVLVLGVGVGMREISTRGGVAIGGLVLSLWLLKECSYSMGSTCSLQEYSYRGCSYWTQAWRYDYLTVAIGVGLWLLQEHGNGECGYWVAVINC